MNKLQNESQVVTLTLQHSWVVNKSLNNILSMGITTLIYILTVGLTTMTLSLYVTQTRIEYNYLSENNGTYSSRVLNS